MKHSIALITVIFSSILLAASIALAEVPSCSLVVSLVDNMTIRVSYSVNISGVAEQLNKWISIMVYQDGDLVKVVIEETSSRPIACEVKNGKIIVVEPNSLSEYVIRATNGKYIIQPLGEGSRVRIDSSVDSTSISYASSALSLIDAIINKWSILTSRVPISLNCSWENNTLTIVAAYRGRLEGPPMKAHLLITSNKGRLNIDYYYYGLFTKDVLDLIKTSSERCNLVANETNIPRWAKPLPQLESLPVSPGSVASLVRDLAPSIPSKITVNTTSTIYEPKILTRMKQILSRLLRITGYESKRTRIFEEISREASTITGSAPGEAVQHAKQVSLESPKNSSNTLDPSLLVFPVILAAIAYLAWKQLRVD